jgi:DNA-binding MarR family transcriptional regulator
MTDQRILDAIDELALELVAVTARALTEAVNDLDLTLSQWRVIVVIGQRRASLRVGEIAARIDASLPSTSRILRRLERRGLITTRRDERDRRATLVRLTPAGVAARRKVMQSRQRAVAGALGDGASPLPPSLVDGLEAIVRALAPLS